MTGVIKKHQFGLIKFTTLLNLRHKLKHNHLLLYILVIILKLMMISKPSMVLPKSLMKLISPILMNLLSEKSGQLPVVQNYWSSNITMNNSLNIKENSISKISKNSYYSINILWLLISLKELLKNYMVKVKVLCSYSLIKLLLTPNYKKMLK